MYISSHILIFTGIKNHLKSRGLLVKAIKTCWLSHVERSSFWSCSGYSTHTNMHTELITHTYPHTERSSSVCIAKKHLTPHKVHSFLHLVEIEWVPQFILCWWILSQKFIAWTWVHIHYTENKKHLWNAAALKFSCYDFRTRKMKNYLSLFVVRQKGFAFSKAMNIFRFVSNFQ